MFFVCFCFCISWGQLKEHWIWSRKTCFQVLALPFENLSFSLMTEEGLLRALKWVTHVKVLLITLQTDHSHT